jgi:hypothetical protein
VCASLAACGGSSSLPSSSAPAHGLVKSDQFCEQALVNVRHTTAFNTPNSLNPPALVRTAVALRHVSDHLRSEQRRPERRVAAAANGAARAINVYVRDNGTDAGNASPTYLDMYEALTNLDQVAGDNGLPSCSLIVTS